MPPINPRIYRALARMKKRSSFKLAITKRRDKDGNLVTSERIGTGKYKIFS